MTAPTFAATTRQAVVDTLTDLAGWMQRKTVLKQVLKLVPSSPSLTQALTLDGAVRTDLSFAAIDVLDGDDAIDDDITDAEVVTEGGES